MCNVHVKLELTYDITVFCAHKITYDITVCTVRVTIGIYFQEFIFSF